MEVWSLDGITQIDRITSHTKVTASERDLATGSWSVTLDYQSRPDVADRWAAATRAGVELYDPATGWRFGGFVQRVTSVVGAGGVKEVRFSGFDFQSQLQGRMEWPNPEGLPLWYTIVAGGTIPATSDAHNTMWYNVGGGALAYRRIPFLVEGINPVAGEPRSRIIQGDPLLEVFKTLFDGQGWTARLTLHRPLGWGTDSVLFDTPARALSPVVLTPESGDLGDVEVTVEADAVTFVVGEGGDVPGGLPDQRFIAAAVTPGAGTTWRLEHKETYVARPSTTDIYVLIDEVQAALDEFRRGRTMQIVDPVRFDEGFGQDLDIGWLVDVTVGGVTDRIVVSGSSVDFTPESGWSRTVTLGPSMVDPSARLVTAQADLARKLRMIEKRMTT